MNLTASALYRAEKCPASASLPQIKRLSAASERGTELHADKEAEAPKGAEVAYALNVETGAVRHLGNGKKREYGELHPREIAGTLDREIVEADRVIVRDYKSGYGYMVRPAARNLQLGFGAVCAATFHGKDAARVEIEYIDQDGRIDGADLDAFDLATIRERIRNIWTAATKKHPQVVTGEHCHYCPCIARCPAYVELACAVSGELLPSVIPSEGLTAEVVAKGWNNVKALKRLLGEVERAYRGFAALWPVPLGDGKFLGERMREREELDGRIVRQVLRDLHGEAVAEKAVELSATKVGLERALAEIAPPRGKSALIRSALKAIEEANGITVTKKMEVTEYNGGE